MTPQHPVLASGLQLVLDLLPPRAGTCIAISGSIARGCGDRYSDIDLWYIAREKTALELIRKDVIAAMGQVGHPMASFAATHLGSDDLLVFFSDFQGDIVKVDVDLAWASEFRRPPELVSVRDPEGLFGTFLERLPPAVDAEQANQRVTGWLWYAYTKIARGELFEASEALNLIRKLAVISLQLVLAGAPLEGYRRIEQKLERSALEALHNTYPDKIEAESLIGALLEAALLFRKLYACVIKNDAAPRLNRLDRMIGAVLNDLHRSRERISTAQ